MMLSNFKGYFYSSRLCYILQLCGKEGFGFIYRNMKLKYSINICKKMKVHCICFISAFLYTLYQYTSSSQKLESRPTYNYYVKLETPRCLGLWTITFQVMKNRCLLKLIPISKYHYLYIFKRRHFFHFLKRYLENGPFPFSFFFARNFSRYHTIASFFKIPGIWKFK